ncbi:hypothetical protein ACFQY8_07415, partial [Alloscardovia venturai]
LIGAGLDALIQQGTTGNVDWGEVAVGTVAGLAGGSIIGKTGGILAKSTLGIRVAQKVGSVDSKFVRWGIGKLGEFAQDKLSEVTGNLIESGTNTLLHRPTNWSESIANPFTAEGLAKSAVSTGIGNGSIHAAESYYGKELAHVQRFQFKHNAAKNAYEYLGADASPRSLRENINGSQKYSYDTLYAPGKDFHRTGSGFGSGSVKSVQKMSNKTYMYGFEKSSHKAMNMRKVYVIDLPIHW